MQATVWLGAAFCVFSVGCGDCGKKPESNSKPTEKPPQSVSATLTGRIEFAEGFEVPRYAPEDMERKVLQVGVGAAPEVCSPPKKTDRRPVLLTDDGLLSGVMVAASGFTGATPRPPKTHTVTIEDCRLTPPLVVAMKGDTLAVRNSVQYAFMPTFGPSATARALMPNQKLDIPLNRGGVESVLCTITAGCGRTDVVTLLHPISAITDASGHFEIENFPAGQNIRVNVWHPLFEEASLEVQLAAGERKDVKIVLAPKPRFQTEDGKIGAKTDLSKTPLQRSVGAAAKQADGGVKGKP